VGPFWAHLDHAIKVRLPIVIGVVLLAVLFTGIVTDPVRRAIGYEPTQPIDFSHQQHAGDLRIDCRYCHTGVETSRDAGIPAVSICMNCHSVAAIDSPGVAQLRLLYEQNKPIVWKRIHRLPDFVYFSHSSHIQAGVDCAVCHGDVAQMDVVRQVHPLTMRSCLDCHRNPHDFAVGLATDLKGSETCTTCHR